MKPPKGKPRELAPEGTHLGCLISIHDLGTQVPTNPQFSKARKCYFNFELLGPKLKKENGDPFFMRKEYTFTAKSKNLKRDLKAWLNVKEKDFADYDIDKALGKFAMIKVEHTEDGQYDNIVSISEVPAGVKVLKPTTPLSSFYLDEYDDAVFKALPEWLQNKIATSDEYKAAIETLETSKATKGKGKKK